LSLVRLCTSGTLAVPRPPALPQDSGLG
jgi:hypothetical protein